MNIDVTAIYKDLEKISNAGLDVNPKVSMITPAFLQEKTLECELHAAKVERHELTVRQALDTAKKILSIEKENYAIKHRAALIHNDTIKKLPTGKEREAAVDELLELECKKITEYENKVMILENVAGAIKTVHGGISRKDGRIKVLMRLMEQQLNRLNVGLPDDPDVSELTKGFAEIESMEDEMTPDDVESSTEYQETEDLVDVSETAHPSNGTPETDSQEDSEDAPDILSAFLGDEDEAESRIDPSASDSEENESEPETAQSKDEVDTPNETGTVANSEEAVYPDSGGLDLGDICIDGEPEESTKQTALPESSMEIELDEINIESSPQTVPVQEEKVKVSEEPKSKSEDSGGIDIDAFLADFDD